MEKTNSRSLIRECHEGSSTLLERVLLELYSARREDGLIPLTDRCAPAFESEPAEEAIADALHAAGFTSLTYQRSLKETLRRRIYARSPEDGGPVQIVRLDWSSHPGEIYPCKDISGPTAIPVHPFAYVRGIPNGLVGNNPITSRPATCTRERTPMVSEKQVFLPLFDPITGMEGWQFAFPPVQNGVVETDLSILLLTRDGVSHRVQHPVLCADQQGLRMPLWAWVPIQTPCDVLHGRLAAPNANDWLPPVGPVTELDTDLIYTPEGAERRGRDAYPAVTSWDIPVPESPDGSQEVWLGDLHIATVAVWNGQIDYIEPQEGARRLGLWSCHLARVAQTFLLRSSDL